MCLHTCPASITGLPDRGLVYGRPKLADVNRPAACYPYFSEPFAAMAHRGGYLDPSDAGRENSLYAFGRAVDLGYRYLETDVHVTADGHLVAFHDQVLDRVTDANGVLAELSFAAVREARIAGVDQIPTLDEVLESFPDVRINIDIKAPGATTALVRVLQRHRAQHRVCVSSFSRQRLSKFRSLLPEVATGMTVPAVAFSAYVPLLPRLIRPGGQVFQIPVTEDVKGHRIRVLTAQLLRTAHKLGARVHVWTINDPGEMGRLMDLGVDGIISDRIGLLQEVARSHQLWAD